MLGLTKPVRVLHLSDVHLRGPGRWLQQLCRVVAKQCPDLLILTGDMVMETSDWGAAETQALAPDSADVSFMSRATGNVFWVRLHRFGRIFLRSMTSNVWTIAVDLGEWILAGVDDWLAGEPRLNEVLVPPSTKPMVLLAHTPTTVMHYDVGHLKVQRCSWSCPGIRTLTNTTAAVDPLLVAAGTGPYVGGWYEAGGISVSRGVAVPSAAPSLVPA